MFKNLERGQKVSIAIAVVVVAIFIVHRMVEEPTDTVSMETAALPTETTHSSVITYPVPGGTHTIDFTIYADGSGLIKDVKFTDTTDPAHQENVDKFSAELLPQLQGRNLRDIGPVDKVGTSSLTTDAFNLALADIKAKL